jgi:hypothetical protein
VLLLLLLVPMPLLLLVLLVAPLLVLLPLLVELLLLCVVPSPRLSPVPPQATNVNAIMLTMAIRQTSDMSLFFREIETRLSLHTRRVEPGRQAGWQ